MKTLTSIAVLILLFQVTNVKSQNPLTDSLIAYYPFNGTALDASGHGNNGTTNGATLVSDRFGNPSEAYYFDGVNDYINYTATSNYKPTDFPVSITAWIKSNTPSDVGTFFKNDNAINVYTGFIFQVQVSLGGVVEVHYGDGGPTGPPHRRSLFGSTYINDDQWHFVAAVIRGPVDMDLYVDCAYENGYYDGSGGNLAYTSNDGASGIYDVASGTYYYKGSLDELRFYHRELTLTDLQTIYSFPNPLTNLSVSLPADTFICSGSQLTLSPVTTGAINSYLWSDGSQNSMLTVSTPGLYYVSVFDGCSFASDSIVVGLSKAVGVNLPADTSLCEGEEMIITPGSFYDTYAWSTGASTSSITVADSGIYTVTVSLNGCSATDSIEVLLVTCDDIHDPLNSGFILSYIFENHMVTISSNNIADMSVSLELINFLGQTVWRSAPFKVFGQSTFVTLPDYLNSESYIVIAKSGGETVGYLAIPYLR